MNISDPVCQNSIIYQTMLPIILSCSCSGNREISFSTCYLLIQQICWFIVNLRISSLSWIQFNTDQEVKDSLKHADKGNDQPSHLSYTTIPKPSTRKTIGNWSTASIFGRGFNDHLVIRWQLLFSIKAKSFLVI